MLAALVAAITLAGPQAAAPVGFRTVDQGADSRIDAHYELVARNAGTWHFVWFKHKATPNPPQVDLGREMVVGVFAGRQPPGAYSLEIATVTHEDGELVVRYRIRRVEAATSADGVQRTPFHIIAVPAHRGKVRFLEMRELSPGEANNRHD